MTVDEVIKVENHRAKCFLGLGYSPTEAIDLAEDGETDWHEVERLINNGCSHELAARICAPIGSKRRSI